MLMPGKPPKTHNKSFIVGIANTVFSDQNEFYILPCDDPGDTEKKSTQI